VIGIHLFGFTMPHKSAAADGGVREKASAPKSRKLAKAFPSGIILNDSTKKDWKLGTYVGRGGFGRIYLASDLTADTKPDEYVIKIEPANSGPLFQEMHFYQRVAGIRNIKEFKRVRKLKCLGIPRYIASGLTTYKSRDYRFLVMPRLGTDLQKLLQGCGGRFPPQTIYAFGLQIVNALQFIHEKGYVHADIKASNILLGFSGGHDVANEIYLVDYGLAYRYTVDGKHKKYKEDPKKAHDGTIGFTSRDAHKGLAPARRGDLEILGYCMLQWSCGKLPWEDKLSDPIYVAKSKESLMDDIDTQLSRCIPDSPNHLGCLQTYFHYVSTLEYQSQPDYDYIRKIFEKMVVPTLEYQSQPDYDYNREIFENMVV
jgi:vaccinia related kinase